MIIPVSLTISDSAPTHLGFRPSRMPPFRATAMRISHIIPGSYVDIAGIQVGDFVTHVNGTAVGDMLSPEEFLSAIAKRPCQLSLLLQADEEDLRVANAAAVKLKAHKAGAGVDELFLRLYGTSGEGDSQLFDVKNFKSRGNFSSSDDPEAEPQENSEEEVVELDEETGTLPQIRAMAPSLRAENFPAGITSSQEAMTGQMEVSVAQSLPPQQSRRKTSFTGPSSAPMQLYPLTPSMICVEILGATNAPRQSGIFASDPLWQPMTSEPFVEVFLVDAAGKIITKRLQTDVDVNCAWAKKFFLPLTRAGSDLSLVFRLCDYRRFTEHMVMGETNIPVQKIPLVVGDEGPLRSFQLESTVQYFDVSKTTIEAKLSIPAAARPAQVANAEVVKEAVEAEVVPYEPVVSVKEESVQTETEIQNVDQVAGTDTPGHIPWIYEKWHWAVSRRI